jgi:predicted ester cyclase
MSAIDIVKEGLAAVETGDFNKLDGMIDDDMVFAGPVPQPVGKREFMGLQMALVKAMPDWKFNTTDMKENGDQVTMMFQITGTQTGELSLPMPGFPKVPPSGKKVSLPREPTMFTLKNGKVTRIEAAASANGGVQGILMQLGVPIPPMS